MAVTQDIWQTYRGPSRVVGRLLQDGRQEVRALLFALIACALVFVALAPYQAREAALNPEGPLSVRLYWSAFLWIFVMPLLLYVVSTAIWLIFRLFGSRRTAYEVRLTLFWALLAASPVLLLLGLVLGLIGPGLQAQIVGVVWAAVVLWFWIGGLFGAGRATA
ncbi:YIP1 family protein [Sulfitobacter sp. D35]|uniref:YIP1 family protein n=1 Tax=Sulfitobacter sp. D35 TaxID=3083252 RepID=UPI00296F0188|nr:YIP1 family protein [Sulfitobacter sp. D35]MDW4497855.1 YIP1 family protein [Sulfitobacter sp. D35]